MPNSRVAVKDESNQRSYFVVRPRIVWALSRDPFDIAFWETVYEIAGENGECYVGIRDLAKLARMSTWKARACRSYLIKVGLLRGYVQRDPGQDNAVWHLSIPDLWHQNSEWAQRHLSMASRLEYLDQKAVELAQSAGELLDPVEEEGCAPHAHPQTVDNSVDNPVDNSENAGGCAPHAQGCAPDAQGCACGSTKEDPLRRSNKEDPKEGAARRLWGLILSKLERDSTMPKEYQWKTCVGD